jgi:hypothetical protein
VPTVCLRFTFHFALTPDLNAMTAIFDVFDTHPHTECDTPLSTSTHPHTECDTPLSTSITHPHTECDTPLGTSILAPSEIIMQN